MKQLWWRAPGLALRLAVAQQPSGGHEAAGWELNPAATAWAAQRGVPPQQWAPLAAALIARIDAGHRQGRVALDRTGAEFNWSAVPLEAGWLVWLEPATGDVNRLLRRLDMVQTLGRMASWERDLATGESRWDAHMFELLGLDPAQGMPRSEAALALVHPDDRARLEVEYTRFALAAGRYETHYRLVTPAGAVKDIRALCEVENGSDGTPSLMTGLLIDETEIADRLRTSEATAALWVRAVDLAAVALWRLDLLNQRVYFSDWGYRMLGLDPEHDKLTVEGLREL
ncbi:MAG TPA: PAS domain-containing protein, partial [Rhizobacter sp.]